MPRNKPIYEWPITNGEPLKNEPSRKRVTYKSGGKKFKEAKPPASLPTNSVGQGDVKIGSHKDCERQIKAERERLKLC